MPLSIRAKGVSLSTSTNWAFNFLVGEVTPYLQDYIEWRLYPMHGFFCVCSFVLVYFRKSSVCFAAEHVVLTSGFLLSLCAVYPETKGVPLEEMDAVFGEDLREEQEDNESEVTSLVSSLPTNASSHARATQRRRRRQLESKGWFSRLLGGNERGRASYEAIETSD